LSSVDDIQIGFGFDDIQCGGLKMTFTSIFH